MSTSMVFLGNLVHSIKYYNVYMYKPDTSRPSYVSIQLAVRALRGVDGTSLERYLHGYDLLPGILLLVIVLFF